MTHNSIVMVLYLVRASADAFYWTGAAVWIIGAVVAMMWMLSLVMRLLVRLYGITSVSVLELRESWRTEADVSEFMKPAKKKGT